MTPSASPNGIASREIVLGLDSLRFFAALAVAAGHLAANMPVEAETAIGGALWRMVELGANGRVAVALFFVISGFCIHLRQAVSLRVDAAEFLVRRGIRIGLPLIGVALLANCLGSWAVLGLQAVLWSVYCELIYYAAYPAILALRRRYSMERILLFSSAVSGLLVTGGLALHVDAFYGAPSLAYCLPLLPLWLLGAWLAERHRDRKDFFAPRPIIWWRLAAIALGFAANQVKLLDLQAAAWVLYAAVALFCYFYLPRELAHWRSKSPASPTERLGRASYSLYLVHILPISLMIQLAVTWPFWAVLSAQLLAITAIAFAFYFLCELPAHRLARSFKRRSSALSTQTANASAP